MAKKKATKREALQNVPQNREELTEAVARIGALKRKVNEITNKANEEISEIQKKADQDIAPLSQELDAVFSGIHAYAESNREELTEGGKTKTVTLTTGKLFWRTNPLKVNLQKIDDVLAALKRLKLDRFIRTKEEPNKEAMQKEPEAVKDIKGISFLRNEEFGVEPSEFVVEVVKKLPSKKS